MTIISLIFLLSCAVNLKQHYAILFSKTFLNLFILYVLSYKTLYLDILSNISVSINFGTTINNEFIFIFIYFSFPVILLFILIPSECLNFLLILSMNFF
jgi:hypothetical protein